MNKQFSLKTLELAEAAIKDAPNFGLSASLKEQDGEFLVSYESQAREDYAKSEAITWDDVYSVMRSYTNDTEYALKWIKEDVQYLYKALAEHKSGHLPAIKDAGVMQKALKALGLGESFTVATPVVFVEY